MGDKKSSEKFHCDFCYYKTSRKSQWDRHILTAKHKQETLGLQMDDILVPQHMFICICGSQYKCRQGLWKHKKKYCKIISSESSAPEEKECDLKALTNLVLDVVKQNQDLTNKIVDICKSGQTNNITNSSFNSHNKTFNLQFFLNETCKDAMNIMDFVESIKLQLSDLESIGRLGFVNGISNIITTNLKALDVTQRPVHCADNKREVLYIKDDNKWEKEDDKKKKLRKAIKRVATKNLCLIPKFKEAYPDCNRASSKYSDQYNKIIVEACGGSGDNDTEKEDKIISKIAKEVTINKRMEILK